MTMLPCTCESPSVVDFSTTNGSYDKKKKTMLIENLSILGWCPIRLSSNQVLSINPPSKQKILDIFKRSNHSGKFTDLTFVGAESGSNQGTIEPKESLEVESSKCCATDGDVVTKSNNNNNNNNDTQEEEQLVKSWCQGLSWIAHFICKELEIPPNVLLSDDDASSSLDLLRVFHYYTTTATTTKQPQFGSSEHTDWGSWTVVWQDDVGGLQTYCRCCHKWIDVPPSTSTTTTTTTTTTASDESNNTNNNQEQFWDCVIHVGDMASLVLGDKPTTTTTTTTEATGTSNILWPSPKHRVVASTDQDRVSLVYFGYPPANKSLCDIQRSLQDWNVSNRGHCLPYEEYYLLQDQSVSTTTSSKTTQDGGGGGCDNESSRAERTFESVQNLTLKDVVRLKWQQVNRS
jgi:hypothetical protein